jgi:hypothetical protein
VSLSCTRFEDAELEAVDGAVPESRGIGEDALCHKVEWEEKKAIAVWNTHDSTEYGGKKRKQSQCETRTIAQSMVGRRESNCSVEHAQLRKDSLKREFELQDGSTAESATLYLLLFFCVCSNKQCRTVLMPRYIQVHLHLKLIVRVEHRDYCVFQS